MATKKKSTSTVTRIKASSTPSTSKTTKKAPTTTKPQRNKKAKGILSAIAAPFVSIGGYFKGSWYELRQVRWPNRQATWSLTVAVLIFTAFFATLILLLDAGFKYLFELILT